MFSSDKNIETIEQLVKLLKHYIGLQSEYMKLDVVDKIVRLLTVFTMIFILVGLLILMLIYLSFAVAYALATAIGMAAAFCVVSAVYLIIFLLFIVFRHQWIERPLVKFLASILLQK